MKTKLAFIVPLAGMSGFLLFLFLVGCEKFVPQRIIKIKTDGVTNVSYSSCSARGTVLDPSSEGIQQHGFCWGLNQNPTLADNKTELGSKSTVGSFSSVLNDLIPGKTYYIRAYALNKDLTVYGVQKTFTTQATSLAILTTKPITNITDSTAQSGGNITDDGGATVTARGVCWSTSANPTTADSKTIDGSGTGSFTSNLTWLTPNTTYYVQAYATNSVGTAYGNEVSFTTTTTTGTVTDIDGNVYNTVTIGTQVWMAENLKTTKYNDGMAIPLVTDATSWSNLITPGYCWYNNDEAGYKNVYGALYNWFTVNTGKLCPTGWHIPTDAEWTTLTDYLGGENVAGGKLKETGTIHWATTNTGVTNETGFTALPGGYRNYYDGGFYNVGNYGNWWSATESNAGNAWYWYMNDTLNNVGRYNYSKRYGFSVRCLRDQ